MHANALATFPETKNAPGKAGGTVVLLLAEREGLAALIPGVGASTE